MCSNLPKILRCYNVLTKQAVINIFMQLEFCKKSVLRVMQKNDVKKRWVTKTITWKEINECQTHCQYLSGTLGSIFSALLFLTFSSLGVL